jgi:hypothetical protein
VAVPNEYRNFSGCGGALVAGEDAANEETTPTTTTMGRRSGGTDDWSNTNDHGHHGYSGDYSGSGGASTITRRGRVETTL